MGKVPKDQPRQATKQIERELLKMHTQLGRIADLVEVQYEKLTDLIVRIHSLNEEPGLTESAAEESAQRARHRATPRPAARKKQGHKARK